MGNFVSHALWRCVAITARWTSWEQRMAIRQRLLDAVAEAEGKHV
jgi:hypothetical protein